jgi:hypothetical protein
VALKFPLKSIGSWIRGQVWSRIGFIGRSSVCFEIAGEGLKGSEFAADVAPNILIVGRSLCYDIEKAIPVDSWIEAREIAYNMPVLDPFHGLRRVRLQPSDGGGFRAVITLIDIEKIRAHFGIVPRGLIPFSWLIPAIANGEAAKIEFGGEQLLYAPAASGFISSSAISDEHCRDFWWSIDVESEDVSVYDEEYILAKLPASLWSMEWNHWVETFRGSSGNNYPSLGDFDWLKIGKISGIYLLGYLSVTSFILGLGGVWSQSEAKNEPPLFKEALALRGSINKLTAQHEEWGVLVGQQYPIWAIWPTLQAITKDKVAITSLKYDSGVVEIFVLADDATDVLDDVISSSFTSDAAFGAPVQKDPRTQQDRFSVTWKLVDNEDGQGGRNYDP